MSHKNTTQLLGDASNEKYKEALSNVTGMYLTGKLVKKTDKERTNIIVIKITNLRIRRQYTTLVHIH